MKAWLRRGALAVAALGLASVAALGGGVWWLRAAMRQPGPLADAAAIVVPRGTTTQLANDLAARGLILRPAVFRAAAWLTRADGALHAAEFAFPVHASINEVLAVLRGAKPVEHHVTIPEGLTARQIQAILAHAPAMTGGVRPIEEGRFLPQTYDYEYGTARSAIAARGGAAMERALDEAWTGRAPGLPLAGPDQALVLASIVERETAKPDERPHVAAVYLNRLRSGMRLQADPTVIYAASDGAGALDHPLTRAELDRDDPFNTYRSAGLPPAPICSPGVDSLRAVLHPADSGDLYFVADRTGGHVFSRSYAEHDSAVARLRSLSAPQPQAGLNASRPQGGQPQGERPQGDLK